LKSACNWYWGGRIFIASDASPFIEYTSNAVYLDGEMAVIDCINHECKKKIKDDSVVLIQELKMNLEQIEREGTITAERDLRAT
jgi:glucosamine--fructose-6-phosphate aminotransferase (isomerizing)